MHYDNPGRPNKRVLTMLVYLNPDWTVNHGGEIQITPFLRRPTSVAPIANRAVIFASDRVLHRVLPARTERDCFTIWLDGEPDVVNTDTDVNMQSSLLQGSAEEVVRKLSSAPSQRIIARAVCVGQSRASN